MNILPTLGPGRPPRPRPKIARRPMLMPTFSLPMANRRRLAEDDGDDEYISSDTDEPSLGASASRVNSGSGSGSLGPNGPSTQSSWRDSTVLHGVVTEEPESLPLKVSVDTNRDLPPLPGRKRGFSLPLRISSLPAFPGLPAAITSPRIASFAGGILDRVVPERARSLSQPRRKRGKGNSKSRGNQGIGKSKKNDGDYTSAKSHMDKRRSFGWPCDPAMPDGERQCIYWDGLCTFCESLEPGEWTGPFAGVDESTFHYGFQTDTDVEPDAVEHYTHIRPRVKTRTGENSVLSLGAVRGLANGLPVEWGFPHS